MKKNHDKLGPIIRPDSTPPPPPPRPPDLDEEKVDVEESKKYDLSQLDTFDVIFVLCSLGLLFYWVNHC